MFNFKDFEKVAEDKDTTTMKHKSGHTIQIKNSALSSIQREQMKRLKMSKGGDVLDTGKEGTSTQGDSVREGKVAEAKVEAKSRADLERKTQKPKIKNMAEGGMAHYDEGTPDDTVSKDDAGSTSMTHNGSPITINVGAPSREISVPNGIPGQPPMAPPQPAAPVADNRAMQPTQVMGPGANMMSPDQTANVPAALKQIAGANQREAGLVGQQAKANAQFEQQYIDKETARQQNLANDVKELQGHLDEWSDFQQNNKVNPNAYMENMGAGQRVGTAISLFLGGLGGGLTHQGNPALDFLNKQIDRDIDAQKDRMNRAQTIYGAYEHLYGDQVIANNMTKMSMIDMLSHQSAQTAASLGTQQAAIRAQQLNANLFLEKQQLMVDTAGRLGTLKTGANQQPQQAGPQSMTPQQGPGASNSETAPPDSILHPGAAHILEGLKYNPVWKDKLPEITKQYTQAQQADKNLASVKQAYYDMVGEVNGISGRIHRSINPHAAAAMGAGIGATVGGGPGAGVGAALGEGLGQVAKGMTNTSANRAYDSDQAALANHITAALKGAPVTADIINKAVEDNSPETGDSPALVKKKIDNIIQTIRNNTETSLLDAVHLTNK